jgi:hypothetical protein
MAGTAGVSRPAFSSFSDCTDQHHIRRILWGNIRVAISAITKINRKDRCLTWNAALETGGILVGDEITITLDFEFVKA